jgi:hypothetical protein
MNKEEPYDWNFREITEDELLDQLGFCGCGRPRDALTYIKNVLEHLIIFNKKSEELHEKNIAFLSEEWDIL